MVPKDPKARRLSLRLRLGVHKGMKWNDYKGMERN